MLSGIALTTATAAGVTLATLPAVVALLSRWFLHETLTLRVWVAIATRGGRHRVVAAGERLPSRQLSPAQR